MRMKTVFRNYDECAHVWAQQKQTEGSTRGKRMFFEGPSIYSYGYHFEIARFVKPGLVLFTTRSYSNTTATHKHSVAGALSSALKVFKVYSFDDHTKNVEGLVSDFSDKLARIKKMRSFTGDLASLKSDIKTAAAYAKTFRASISKEALKGLHAWTRKVNRLLTADELKTLKAREKKFTENAPLRRAAAEKAQKTRWANKELYWKNSQRISDEMEAYQYALDEIKQRELDDLTGKALEVWAEDVNQMTREAWRNGDRRADDFVTYDGELMLRVIDSEIETTRGAYVPLASAHALWERLSSGAPVHGMEVGHYTVTGIKDRKLIIGCHEIPLPEVYRTARALGWTNGAPLQAL